MQKRKRAFLASACLLALWLAATLSPTARADGWENVETQTLISRSRFVGVGQLWIDGKTDDGWLKGKIIFSQRIYSAIGDVKEYPVRVAPKTVPGVMQHWPSRQKGIWFILKSGDKYEPINHPACWMDESQARAVASQAYAVANKAYEEAKSAAQKQSSGGSGDTSDSGASVSAYGAMVNAADAARQVPYQDQTRQCQQFYEQVMGMLGLAGIHPPVGGDLSDPARQNEFFEQARQMFGPAGAAMGQLPGRDDPSRATQLATAQNNVASVYLELIRNTLGSANPAESLARMGKVPLQSPGGNGASAPAIPGPPGNAPAGANPPQFEIPKGEIPASGTRKQMLGTLMNHTSGPAARPAPKGPPGPRPGPR